MNKSFFAFVSAAALLLPLGGCAVAPSQPWSTKSQSLNTLSVVAPVLAVSLAATDDATPEGLREAAIELLLQACDSTYALLRANSLEAMREVPDQIEPLVRRGLVDQNRGVRFVATMTIGQLQLKQLAHLLEPLLRPRRNCRWPSPRDRGRARSARARSG